MNKNISVVVAGSGEVRDITITPDTKLGEVLSATGLQGYNASMGPNAPFLRAEDDLYAAVPEGAKVYVSTPAEAGCS